MQLLVIFLVVNIVNLFQESLVHFVETQPNCRRLKIWDLAKGGTWLTIIELLFVNMVGKLHEERLKLVTGEPTHEKPHIKPQVIHEFPFITFVRKVFWKLAYHYLQIAWSFGDN